MCSEQRRLYSAVWEPDGLDGCSFNFWGRIQYIWSGISILFCELELQHSAPVPHSTLFCFINRKSTGEYKEVCVWSVSSLYLFAEPLGIQKPELFSLSCRVETDAILKKRGCVPQSFFSAIKKKNNKKPNNTNALLFCRWFAVYNRANSWYNIQLDKLCKWKVNWSNGYIQPCSFGSAKPSSVTEMLVQKGMCRYFPLLLSHTDGHI